MDLLTRFSSKVEARESGCHEWQSTLSRQGYGKFWFDGKQAPAHRVAYLLYVEEIPEGMWVLHKCDNMKCVNPEHLYLGDARQNAKDRTDRQRWTHERLPLDEVQQIRDRYNTGTVSQQQLADETGYHQGHISRIVRDVQRTIK